VIAILDTLKTIKPDVSTIAFGQSLSTATLLLVSPATPVGVMLHSSRDSDTRLNMSLNERLQHISCGDAGGWHEGQALRHAQHADYDAPARWRSNGVR